MPVPVVEVRNPEDFDAAFATMVTDKFDAVVILADPTFLVHRGKLGELCLKYRLPSVWGHKDYLETWGVASENSGLASDTCL